MTAGLVKENKDVMEAEEFITLRRWGVMGGRTGWWVPLKGGGGFKVPLGTAARRQIMRSQRIIKEVV